MEKVLAGAFAGLSSLAVLSYSVLVLHQPIFGIVAGLGIVSTYGIWQTGRSLDAAVIGSAWALLAFATWTAKLRIILPTAVVAALIVLGWRVRNQQPKMVR